MKHIALAQIILQGLIPLDQVAEYFHLTTQQTLSFIEDTSLAMQYGTLSDTAFDAEAAVLEKKLDAFEENLKETKIKTGSIQIFADSVEHRTQVMPSGIHQITDVQFHPLIKPSMFLVFSAIQLLKDPMNRANMHNWLSFSTAAVANLHSVLEKTAFTTLSRVAGTSVAAGVNAGIGLIKEYQYRRMAKETKKQLEQTTQEVEQQYLLLHQMYNIIYHHYARIIASIKNQQPFDPKLYQKKCEEWIAVVQYVDQQILQQQIKIATISAMTQQEQSKRRLERVQDGIATLVTMTQFAGPPGLIASAIIKTAADLGVMIGNSMIANSANRNHGITSASHVLLITDEDSLRIARDLISTSINPAIAISGPILGTRVIGGIDIDKTIYTTQTLAEALVATVGNRRSCSFSLSKPLPEIPLMDVVDFTQTYDNNREMKKLGKKYLKMLIEGQKAIIEEIIFLQTLASKMMKAHNPWPYVINYVELLQSLSDTHAAILQQAQLIEQQMGEAYRTNTSSEGMELLNQLRSLQFYFEHQMSASQELAPQLEETPNGILFKNGTPILLSATTPEERLAIITTYSDSLPAIRMLLNDTEFSLNALGAVLDTCEYLGKGRHISNSAEAILELEIFIMLLSRAYEAVVEKLQSINTHDLIKLRACKEQIDVLSRKSAKLDSGRMEHVTRTNELTERQKYQEITSLMRQLINYNENLPPLHLNIGQTSPTPLTLSMFHVVERAQSSRLPDVEEDLKTPTPIDQNQLAITDQIVTPSRIYFGFTKHNDMLKDIEEKITLLLKNPRIHVIQVMPLRSIDESTLAACRGEYSQLKDVIEGVKTEIQWFNTFRDTCATHNINIANVDNIIQHYERQIQILEVVCQDKDANLGRIYKAPSMFSRRTPGEIKAKVQNSYETIRQGSEKELELAKKALVEAKNYAQNGILSIPTRTEESPTNSGAKTQVSHAERSKFFSGQTRKSETLPIDTPTPDL